MCRIIDCFHQAHLAGVLAVSKKLRAKRKKNKKKLPSSFNDSGGDRASIRSTLMRVDFDQAFILSSSPGGDSILITQPRPALIGNDSFEWSFVGRCCLARSEIEIDQSFLTGKQVHSRMITAIIF